MNLLTKLRSELQAAKLAGSTPSLVTVSKADTAEFLAEAAKAWPASKEISKQADGSYTFRQLPVTLDADGTGVG